MEQGKKPRIFYGWIIVIGCVLIQGAAVGVFSNPLSVFIKPVSEALAIPRATFTAYTSCGMITMIIMSPIWGEFFKTRRFKPYMILSTIIMGSGMFLYSFATKYWQFYIIAAINGIFNGALIGVPISNILSNWFIEKRGTATGIAYAGSGFAGMIMTPLLSRVVQNAGWQWGYRMLSIIFLCLTIPALLFIIKEKPADMGLLPLGMEDDGKDRELEVKPAPIRPSGMTRAQALRSKTFWTYAISLFMIGVFCMSVQNNTISHLSDVGYSPTYAAGVFSACMGVLTLGKIVLGVVYDRFGMTVGTVYQSIGVMVAAVALAVSHGSNLTPLGYIIGFGFGNAIQTVPLAYMTPKLFGTREYTRIFGTCQPAYSLGAAVGVPLSAAVRDMCGSYIPVFWICVAGAAAFMVLMCASVRFSREELQKFDAVNNELCAED